jgi:hypothetical protein
MAYTDEPDDEPGSAIAGDYPEDLDELGRRLDGWDRELTDHWSEWKDEARFWFAMVAGDQWTREEKDQLAEQMRTPIVFNQIGPMCDAVAGAEITNRQEVRFFPREVGDSAVNDVLTAAAEWARQECDAGDEESDAFFDCIVCGIGWTESRMDYEQDPEGMHVVERVDPLEILHDRRGTKKNAQGARYLRRDRIYGEEEFEERFPEADFVAGGVGDATQRRRHQDARNAYKRSDRDQLDVNDPSTEDGECLVREYQWWDLETYVVAYDETVGQQFEMSLEQYANLVEQLARYGVAPPEAVTRKRRVYWRAFRRGAEILEVERLPDDEFTYKPITGKRDRNKGTWYGIVRAMCDPQRWSNKFFERILHIINSNAKGGVMLEEGAVEDPDEFEENWGRPDGVSWFRQGALTAGKVQNKPLAPYPQGLDRLMQIARQGVQEASGVNKEMLGLADRQQAGVLEFQRKQAAYGMLAAFFDSLRRYRRLQGRLLLKHITKYMSDGRLVRVVGDGGARYVPLLRKYGVTKFDVIVDDAPSGPNQKERVWQVIQSMMPILGEATPDIWAELIMYTPLPASLASKIQEKLAQMGQEPPPDPAQQQLQQAGAQAQVRKMAADAAHKEAQASGEAAKARATQMETELQAGVAEALGLRVQ